MSAGGWAAAMTLARLSARRLLRGRTLWVCAGFALIPIAYAAASPDAAGTRAWRGTFEVAILGLLALLAPLLLASAVAEEREDRTHTYLWTRPMPRWSLIAGKLLAGVPALALLLSVSATGAFLIAIDEPGEHLELLLRALGAIILGSAAAGALAVGIGTLVARQSVAAAIAYMIAIDYPLGRVPFKVSNLSVSFQVERLAGIGDGSAPAAALLWLAGLIGLGLGLAWWRTVRGE